jgi:hypothetical protein
MRIQTFILTSDFTLTEAEALRFALSATKAPLKHMDFCCCNFKEESFSVIVQGIRESRCASQISLSCCTFDGGSTLLLQGLLTTPATKRYSLSVVHSPRLSNLTATFFAEVLRSNCGMSELKFQASGGASEDAAVVSIATALERDSGSVLESLTLSMPFYNKVHFQSLVMSLSKMNYLRKLNISWIDCIPGSNAMLLQALKSNSSIWHVTVDQWETKPAEMDFYAKRNKQVHAILEASFDSVHFVKAWPRVFRAIRECSIETCFIFRALTALGESVGPRSSKQKRSADLNDEKGEQKRLTALGAESEGPQPSEQQRSADPNDEEGEQKRRWFRWTRCAPFVISFFYKTGHRA